MILVSKYMVPKGYIGISLFPFIFVKHAAIKTDKRFVNHEKIHLRQQLEMLVFPFFIWYLIEFLIRYIRYGQWSVAYRAISFEREAYAQDACMDYLEKRRFWNFIKYL